MGQCRPVEGERIPVELQGEHTPVEEERTPVEAEAYMVVDP